MGQEEKIPNGILGLLKKPEVGLVRELPRAMIDLMSQFMEGEVGELEFAIQASRIRSSATVESAKKPEL